MAGKSQHEASTTQGVPCSVVALPIKMQPSPQSATNLLAGQTCP